MTARAYVGGDLEITDLCRDRVMYPPSAERSYWLATGVEDGYDYWLRDDEITVQAYVPHSVCDDCDREALPYNDLCAEHADEVAGTDYADEVAGTDYAYEAWLSEKLGCL